MDAHRFDTLSRHLAMATDRRSVVRGAAGGGFLATLGLLFGRGHEAAAAEEPVICTWEIEAHGSSGPNSAASYNGILTITIEPDGTIDDGTYVLVDGSWNPLLDSHGDPISYDVVGSTHIRTIGFRAERDGCYELDFTGVNRYPVSDCKGPMSGSFHGPDLIDLGGWRTHHTEICTPCRGLVCPPKTFLDTEKCECIPEKCPGGQKVCGETSCVPEECPAGTVYDEVLCICGCPDKECKKGELWCPFACDCIPWKPCTKYDCPPGYVHYLSGEDLCICIKNPCEPKKIVCAKNEVLISNGIECKCVGNDCKKHDCHKGYAWDDKVCGCVPECVKKTCDQDYAWDDKTCSCIPTCDKKDCDSGYVWSDAKCACVPTDCPEVECPNANYTLVPETCECVCGDKTCDGYLKWDADLCDCYCPEGVVCPDGYTFDPGVCDCIPGGCVPETCDQGYEWNTDACKCICAQQECGANHTWDTDSCQCVCIPTLACRPPLVYDNDSCSCVCGLDSCDRGYTLDPEKCVCNPPNDPCSTAPACPPNTTQDPTTCQCLCPSGKPACGDSCACSYGCCNDQCCIG